MKLYPLNEAAAYSPATIRGAWDDTGALVTKKMTRHPGAGSLAAVVSQAETSATDPFKVGLLRLVSDPMGAQTISGWINLMMACSQASLAGNFFWHVHAYVTQGDSDTPRGTLLTDWSENTTNEWDADPYPYGRPLQGNQTMTSVVASAGDRLVIELGYVARNTSTSSLSGQIAYGGDLPAVANAAQGYGGSGLSVRHTGFIEFQNTITFTAEAARVSSELLEYLSPAADAPVLVSGVMLEYLLPVNQLQVVFSSGGLVDIGLTWVEITDKADVMRPHAKIALSDPDGYYGGFKDDRVIQWGRVSRALSDRLGQYESATFTWLQSDTDRLYRGLADDPATSVLKNRPATLRMIDDPSRRALLVPRTMMKGLIREYKPAGPLQWQWTMKDILAAKFSAENTTDQLPARLITRTDFPDCPTGAINKPVPIIYGFVADPSSATAPPVLAAVAADGAYVEAGTLNLGFGASSSAAAVPAGVTVGLAGGGTLPVSVPNGEYGVIVTAVDAGGIESDPQEFYYDGPNGGRGAFADGPLDAGGYVVAPDGTQKIQVSWSASAGAVKYRIYLGTYYYGAQWQQYIEVTAPTVSCEFTAGPDWGDPPTTANITPGANLVNFRQFWSYSVSAVMSDGETAQSPTAEGVSGPYSRAIRIEWAAVPSVLSYNVYRRGAGGTWDRVWSVAAGTEEFEDDLLDTGATYIDGAPSPAGQLPAIPVGTRADVDGFIWYAFLIAGHACSEITDVFQGVTRVDPGNFGVTFAVPGKAGYGTYFPNTGATCQYLDINNRRYTLMFVRGPQGDDAANGVSNITVNVKGIETVGNSTGTLITDGLSQYLHALKNWILQSYQSGSWLAMPVFADETTLPLVDAASFATASGIAAARIAGGYVGAWAIGSQGERITIRELVARLNVSFDVDSGFNARTQFFVSMVDEAAATLAAAAAVLDVTDVHEGSFSVNPVDAEQFNWIPYVYRRDYSGLRPSGWNNTSEEHDATSISDLDETKTSPQIDLHCVRAAAQAQDVIQRRLARSKEPPLLATWTMGMAGLSFELGDLITLTHFGGIGSSGYAARPVRIVRHETDPEHFTVVLEGYDLQRLF